MPANGDPELQGAGSARLEATSIATRCAESILGIAMWDEISQEWRGEDGGKVLVRPVDFEYPVELEEEDENVGLDD